MIDQSVPHQQCSVCANAQNQNDFSLQIHNSLNQNVFQSEFDQSVWRKASMSNTSSGYLPQEYQVTRQFPKLSSEYHFRIEDDRTIMELQNLYNNSISMSKKNQDCSILRLKQKNKNNSSQEQVQNFSEFQLQCSQKFNIKMKNLLSELNNCDKKLKNSDNNGNQIQIQDQNGEQIQIKRQRQRQISMNQQPFQHLSLKDQNQSHGLYFYTMKNDQYDNQAAINQAYNRIKVQMLQEKMEKLSISISISQHDKHLKPKLKFKKPVVNYNQQNKQIVNAKIKIKAFENQTIEEQKQKQKQKYTSKMIKEMRKLTISQSDL